MRQINITKKVPVYRYRVSWVDETGNNQTVIVSSPTRIGKKPLYTKYQARGKPKPIIYETRESETYTMELEKFIKYAKKL